MDSTPVRYDTIQEVFHYLDYITRGSADSNESIITFLRTEIDTVNMQLRLPRENLVIS